MSKSIRVGRNTCAALALMALSQGAAAQSAFDTPAAFEARVMISGVNRGPIHAGGTAELRGTGFTQGQTVTFERGDEVLFKDLPVNEKGEVSAKFDVPADAALGLHPIVVKTDGPDSASVVELKVSPKIDYAGEDKFDITKAELGGGLYQIGVSDANGTIFVTSSAGGRGKPVTSELIKLDGETLEVLARREPAMAPPKGDARHPHLRFMELVLTIPMAMSGSRTHGRIPSLSMLRTICRWSSSSMSTLPLMHAMPYMMRPRIASMSA